MKTINNYGIAFIAMMVAFFVMGFVDLVGSASNYIKNDFQLSDSVAGFLPTMVFFWFLILSVPVGLLMNKIGQRKTVLISLTITSLSLLVPLIEYSFISMLIAFALLGIGNTFLQVSLNPLLSNIVSGEKLASALTFGQFIKATCSFSAPILAAQAAVRFGDWKYLFIIYFIISLLSIGLMGTIKIKEPYYNSQTSGFIDCFSLLKDPVILLFFGGILCHVGIDVGINITAPKLLIERLGMHIDNAVYITSIYFIFRTVGSLTGTFILSKFSLNEFFKISVCLILVALIGLFVFKSIIPLYICIALIGFGNSNIFSIIFSQAMQYNRSKKNEVSGLMIMGVFGGAIFPLLMGIMADILKTQTGALIVILLCVIYLLYVGVKVRE